MLPTNLAVAVSKFNRVNPKPIPEVHSPQLNSLSKTKKYASTQKTHTGDNI